MIDAPAPILLNADGHFPCVIAVDHAGKAVPPQLADLHPGDGAAMSHHYRDIGVEALAHRIAARLNAPILLCQTSRIVIDCNRWLDDPRSIVTKLGGKAIAGNTGLSADQRQERQDAVFWPYHVALGRCVASMQSRHPKIVFLALHSCTRTLNGTRRPWDAGTIWNESADMSAALLRELGRDSTLTLGSNLPYSGRDGVYTVDRHTHGTGIPGCGLEVSDDLLRHPGDQAAWADRVCGALVALARSDIAA